MQLFSLTKAGWGVFMGTSDNNEGHKIFSAFVKCRDALTRSIMKMSVKQEDVDDILQETFIRAFDANKKKEIKSPQNYLFVVSRNLVYRSQSTQSREILADINDVILEQESVSTETDMHYRLKFEAFNKALKELPENNRRAILLRKYYDLSHKEIASKMQVSVSSVEKYIANGLRRCGQALAAQGYEAEIEANFPRKLNQSKYGTQSDDDTNTGVVE